jgi:hypothetical protein
VKKIETIQQFQDYLGAVFGRIEHHAGRVRSTVIVLAGMVAAHADPETVAVRTYAGATKNVIWFATKNGKEYCLSYNHDEECVDVRAGGLQGQAVRQINDDDLGWIDGVNDLFVNGDAYARAA